jgi:hypothetical protein
VAFAYGLLKASGMILGHSANQNPYFFGAWLSLVERLVRDQEVGGSNPLAPTNSFNNLQANDQWALWRLPRSSAVGLAAKRSVFSTFTKVPAIYVRSKI